MDILISISINFINILINDHTSINFTNILISISINLTNILINDHTSINLTNILINTSINFTNILIRPLASIGGLWPWVLDLVDILTSIGIGPVLLIVFSGDNSI